VISGFLITSLILKDLQAGTFSFINFWERRCRRILPPLFAVVAATAVAGWFLYLPNDYDLLGQQMGAQAVFSSNILFKMQEGYFDVASQTKPLLHTWSLAVEEQFYLLFPILAFLTWKYRREKITKYLWICGIITFIGAAFIVKNSPSSAFYLLPFRAWELLLGSLLALYKPSRAFSLKTCNIIALAGLAGIFIPAFIYNDDTLFPGALALPPCLGAAAIIFASTHNTTYVGRILSMRGPVFIGLISYSLYLWHWPILAFTRYSQLFPFTPLMATGCIAAAFTLAIATWHFIEKPIRRKAVLKTTRSAYISALLGLIVIGGAGMVIHQTKGLPQRLSPEVAQLAAGALDGNPHRTACDKPDFSRFDQGTICQLNPDKNINPTIMVWGDSFADALAPAFYDLAVKHNVNGYIVTAHGCPPILGFSQKVYKGFDCPGLNERVFKLIEQKNIKAVFMLGNWTDHLRGDNYDFADMTWYETYKPLYDHVTMAALKRTIDKLEERSIKVYIVIDIPFAPFDPPRYLAMKALYHANKLPETIPLSGYLGGRQNNIDTFMSINAESDITFIDPQSELCDGIECIVRDGNHSLYYNSGHLSVYGARYLMPLFEPAFRDMH
jgi:peptidoglycan/LPS O-acetylase OafA/YrhL